MSLSLESIAEQLRKHPKLVVADDFEIAIQNSQSTGLHYHNGEKTHRSRGERLWISLRIWHRKRGGRAVALNPSQESLSRLVESAFDSANRAAVDPWFRFPMWKARSSAKAESQATLQEYESLFSSIKQPDVLFDESYDFETTETYLRRKTERFDLRHKRSAHHAAFSVELENANGWVQLREERAVPGLLQDRSLWMDELVESAWNRSQRPSKPCGRGKRKVVLAPRVATRLLRAMSSQFFADQAQNGRSVLAGKLGSPLWGEALTLVDDGNHAALASAAPFDLEGSPTQRTVLVDKGTLKSLLHDVCSATRENRLSTGSFIRHATQDRAQIGASAFYIEPGQISRQTLLEQMANGVYWDCLDSIELVPAQPGVFRLRGSGWRVAFGNCSEPLSGIAAEVDVLEVWRSAQAVAKDLSFFAGFGSPSILIESMPLGM